VLRLTTVSRSWPSFRRGLEADAYVPLTDKGGNEHHVVVHASRWHPDYDAEKLAIPVTATQADRQIGLLLHLVRDIGVTFVTYKGDTPDIILEPGEGWHAFGPARLEISCSQYAKVIRNGPLKKLIGGNPKVLRRRLKRVQAERAGEMAQLKASARDAETQRATAKSRQITVEQENLLLRRQIADLQREIRTLRIR
jgi:hypothetical protein